MTAEEKVTINGLVKSVDQMCENVTKALVIRSNDVPSSFSKVIFDMSKKLDEQTAVMEKHVNLHAVNDKKWNEALLRMEPYLKKSEEDREFREELEKRGKIFGMWAGLWLTLAAVIGSIYYGLKHIK